LCLDKDAHGAGPFVRVPFGSDYSDLAGFLISLDPLGAKHQHMVDASLLYRTLTRTSYSDNAIFIGQVNSLIQTIGEHICAHATPEFYDALEDEEENIGLALGLVKAICIAKNYDDLTRVIRLSDRISYGVQFINAKSHLVQAFRELCPHSKDSVALRQVDRIIGRWISEKNIPSDLADNVQALRSEIAVAILKNKSGDNS
jgi:hypothetical protein